MHVGQGRCPDIWVNDTPLGTTFQSMISGSSGNSGYMQKTYCFWSSNHWDSILFLYLLPPNYHLHSTKGWAIFVWSWLKHISAFFLFFSKAKTWNLLSMPSDGVNKSDPQASWGSRAGGMRGWSSQWWQGDDECKLPGFSPSSDTSTPPVPPAYPCPWSLRLASCLVNV